MVMPMPPIIMPMAKRVVSIVLLGRSVSIMSPANPIPKGIRIFIYFIVAKSPAL